MTSSVLAAGLSLALSLGSLEKPDADLARDLARVDVAIDNWDLAAAEALSERLVTQAPEAPEAQLVRARVHFLAGRYDQTLAALREVERRAGPGSSLADGARDFARFVAPLAELGRRFTFAESEHFRIHFEDGPDRVMAERGLEALETCYVEVGADFALYPEGKVRVEIFPDPDSFEKASTLTKQEIETSGTIALCKFNRLMMLSPRTVLRGFPWKDTLCHEFTHYLLWRRNGPSVPIWLHEAIAKYEEIRWRSPEGSALTPLLEEVLKGALDKGEFLGFDQMHPSFAKLKSPHEVALASAEVLSVIRTVMDRGGYELLRRMLDALRDGSDWRGMFERALEQPFERFWDSWRSTMAVALKDVKGPQTPDKLVELRDPMVASKPGPKPAAGASAAANEDEQEEPGGRLARLGDILRARGHHRAAAIEYARAAEGHQSDPILLNRLGLTEREAGDLEAAIRAFERAAAIDPDYAPTLTNLGLAYRARGDAAAAARRLEEAVAVNPFDPRLHEALGEVYGALGKKRESERAARDLRALRLEPEGEKPRP